MDRREFGRVTTALAALGGFAAAGVAPAARAQQAGGAAMPPAGTYKRIAVPVAQTASGKVDVVEFFWYGCPHCYAFEPKLEAWVAKLPPDVQFTRVPVVFRPYEYPNHQRLYYTLEILGKVGELHGKVFDTIHKAGKRLETPEAAADFAAANGIDRKRFLDVFNSFKVQGLCNRANQMMQSYEVRGVPTLAVAGRYLTDVGMNGASEAKTLATVDALIAASRGK